MSDRLASVEVFDCITPTAVTADTGHVAQSRLREREIREGLRSADTFEQAQVQLGEHLGFVAGKNETDASPDPWWLIGDICLVFEDHADAKPHGAVINATKARQAASHPDWIKEKVPGARGAKVLPVLVTPAKKATDGAMPVLNRVALPVLGRRAQ